MRARALVLALAALAAAACCAMTRMPGETVYRLAIGWFAFLSRSCSRLTVNWYGVATAIACVVLLVLGGHSFLKWLISALRSPTSLDQGARAARPDLAFAVPAWTAKRTAQILALFIALFIAGTAFIGLVHQVAWLATSPEPLTQYRLNLDKRDPQTNLKFVAWGVLDFANVYNQYAPNGAAPDLKQASHSWQTRILPFISIRTDNVDFSRDWHDPKNAAAFRRFVSHYLNPEHGVLRENRGYAVSHFAGNSRLLENQHPLTPESIAGGASKTILCGEVAADFQAWGDPANVRDPAGGINRSPAGFYGTDERGAYFLMLDGSVRLLAAHTDEKVLTALATPTAD